MKRNPKDYRILRKWLEDHLALTGAHSEWDDPVQELLCDSLDPAGVFLAWRELIGEGKSADLTELYDQLLNGVIGKYPRPAEGSIMIMGLDPAASRNPLTQEHVFPFVDEWRGLATNKRKQGEFIDGASRTGEEAQVVADWLGSFAPEMAMSLTELRARMAACEAVTALVEQYGSIRQAAKVLVRLAGVGASGISFSYLGRLLRCNVKIPQIAKGKQKIWGILSAADNIKPKRKLQLAQQIYPDMPKLRNMTGEQFVDWLKTLCNERQPRGVIEMQATGDDEYRLVAKGFKDKKEMHERLAMVFTTLNETHVKIKEFEFLDDPEEQE